jgi:serine/threonine protein kinase
MNSLVRVSSDFFVDKSQKLGKGQSGNVFKGYRLSTNQIIAAKFIKIEILKINKSYEREIEVMQDLS